MGLSRRINLVFGAAALAVIGHDRLYMLAQGDGPLSKMAAAFCGDPEVEWLSRNWKHVEEEGSNPRINAATVEHYLSTPDLGGWTKKQQTWGDMHLPLTQQMRGLILPMLEQRIDEGARTVVEIGSSNGDIIAHLAERHPAVKFVGIDFVLPEDPLRLPNLEFRTGYALDLLDRGELAGDVAFGSSTFCLPGPVEMQAYASMFQKAGFETVMIADPVTRAYSPAKYPGRSMHQTFGMWGHDHRAIFGRYGYRATRFEVVDFVGHRRAKLKFQLVRLDSFQCQIQRQIAVCSPKSQVTTNEIAQ